jgi:hypothetical protein
MARKKRMGVMRALLKRMKKTSPGTARVKSIPCRRWRG